MINVAINGLGRIGRTVLKISLKEPQLNVVAVNDIAPIDNIAYLLRHDSVYGAAGVEVEAQGNMLRWGDRHIGYLQERDPADLPWQDLEINVVIEATGLFLERPDAARHLEAGARRVILTAPAKKPDVTLCMGVNHHDYDPEKHRVISNASCTTNCLAPVAKVLDAAFGIETGFLTTVHAVTAGQALVDKPSKKPRRGRSAMTNIVPTSTGAAQATAEVLPQLAGRMDGLAIRVPVIDGSLVDFTAWTRQALDVDAVKQQFREAASGELQGILGISEEELVSSDVIGSAYSALVDLPSTMVIGDRAVKVLAWYDNEWGYAQRVVDLVKHISAMR